MIPRPVGYISETLSHRNSTPHSISLNKEKNANLQDTDTHTYYVHVRV